MQLKRQLKDKINYRAKGERTNLTRQTTKGRANDGGLRIGEMERDSILAHGISDFLNESMMERSDKYSVNINKTTGLVSNGEENDNIVNVNMPYSMKMLLQEIQSMSIAPRLITDKNIENPYVHEFIQRGFKL